MGRMTTSPCEFLLSPPCEPAAPHEEPGDSRTPLKQYLLDPVLPIVTVLVIGALALVMLLLVVATVGDMEQVLRGSGAGEDPWACAATATSPQAYAAYVTSASGGIGRRPGRPGLHATLTPDTLGKFEARSTKGRSVAAGEQSR
jgi:hypothetical protein